MEEIKLTVVLKSPACFSIGEGTVGEVDIEIQHDEYGLPFLNGKTVKGLLHEEAAELVFALKKAGSTENWEQISNSIFGEPGSTADTQGAVNIGDLHLPADFREKIISEIGRKQTSAYEVLRLLTSIRTQTAVDENGAPKPETLRTLRIIPSETAFEASIFYDKLEPKERIFLYSCLMALRRAGSNKSRGLGKLYISTVPDFDLKEEDL
jgi:CRISPR/Cas system CSM-associated protein Csm3 (group 7 of RAMP superfamily)